MEMIFIFARTVTKKQMILRMMQGAAGQSTFMHASYYRKNLEIYGGGGLRIVLFF